MSTGAKSPGRHASSASMASGGQSGPHQQQQQQQQQRGAARAGGPVKVDLALLQEENNSLIHRITKMQESRGRLEERIKDLETLNASLAETAAQKSNIIRDYYMTAKTGRSDMARELHRQDSRLQGIGNAPT